MMRILFLLLIVLLSGNAKSTAQSGIQLMKIQLKRSVFTDDFFLLLQEDAKDHIDVFDAAKISDGYVSISSQSLAQSRLSIDARPFPQQEQTIDLIVKGYAAGHYTLMINPEQAKNQSVEAYLVDRLLDKKIRINSDQFSYEFELDSLSLEGRGLNRFSILLNKINVLSDPKNEPRDLLAFPNPFVEKINLNVGDNEATEATIRIMDIQGKICLRFKFKQVMKAQILEIPCSSLLPGIYLMEWKVGAKVKTLKIIKI